MGAARSGPLYGPLPDLDTIWTIYASDNTTIVQTSSGTRSLIMEILTLASSYKNMHRLSTAMCSMVAMPNPEGVTRVKANIGYWVANQAAIVNEKTTLSADSLPLIEADVIKYSEEPLKQGKTLIAYKLQPLLEEQARLAMRICLDLDIETFGIRNAVCCSGGMSIPTSSGQLTMIQRS